MLARHARGGASTYSSASLGTYAASTAKPRAAAQSCGSSSVIERAVGRVGLVVVGAPEPTLVDDRHRGERPRAGLGAVAERLAVGVAVDEDVGVGLGWSRSAS